MPPSNYRRGRDHEYAAKELFESHGYQVTRAASSKGPADLVACRAGEPPVYVQCKLHGRMGPKEWDAFWYACRRAGAVPVMSMKGERGDGVRLYLVLSERGQSRARPMRRVFLDEEPLGVR